MDKKLSITANGLAAIRDVAELMKKVRTYLHLDLICDELGDGDGVTTLDHFLTPKGWIVRVMEDVYWDGPAIFDPDDTPLDKDGAEAMIASAVELGYLAEALDEKDCDHVGTQVLDESDGDGESGPITRSHCVRCGKTFTQFGM